MGVDSVELNQPIWAKRASSRERGSSSGKKECQSTQQCNLTVSQLKKSEESWDQKGTKAEPLQSFIEENASKINLL